MRLMHLFVCLLFLIGCGPSIESIHKIVKEGKIPEKTSVKASEAIEINASVEKVWNLISDIDNWKGWMPNVTEVKLKGKPAVDVEFDWTNNGTEIHSKIGILEMNKKIGWSGVASIAKAAHIWELNERNGRTIVKTEESFDGFMLSIFFGKKKLSDSLKEWLLQLKKAAEK